MPHYAEKVVFEQFPIEPATEALLLARFGERLARESCAKELMRRYVPLVDVCDIASARPIEIYFIVCAKIFVDFACKDALGPDMFLPGQTDMESAQSGK